MVEMPDEITETLEYEPGRWIVLRTIRRAYMKKKDDFKHQKVIAPLPERPIPKAIAEAGLLAQVIVDKYAYHIPLYRQAEKFKHTGVALPTTTLGNWVKKVCDLLRPLDEPLKNQMLAETYLKIDETTTKVLDQSKEKNKHQGYYWAYRGENSCYFQYDESRSGKVAEKMLENYQGKITTDGYTPYERLEKQEGIQLFACMAHARRKLFELRDKFKEMDNGLEIIAQLYQIEQEARQKNYSHQQRQKLRQAKAPPIIDKLKNFLDKTKKTYHYSTDVCTAVNYFTKRWNKLIRYIDHGQVEIDNNLVENAIRPIAIGRKNYLFAGSHQAAKNNALLYSFIATCKIQKINPYEWFYDVIKKINCWPQKNIKMLLPQFWKK